MRRKEHDARSEYIRTHKNYSMFLGQKAKLKWLNECDNNSKTFHQSIKLRRVQNRLNTIRMEDDTWAQNSQEVVNAFLELYHWLLGSRSPIRKVESAIIAKGTVLSPTQQQALNLNFTGNEIKEALFSIPMINHQE